MIESGRFKNLKNTDGRKETVYPWDLLNKFGDYFIWDNKDDAHRIRTAARARGLKVSVRTIDEKLTVINVNEDE